MRSKFLYRYNDHSYSLNVYDIQSWTIWFDEVEAPKNMDHIFLCWGGEAIKLYIFAQKFRCQYDHLLGYTWQGMVSFDYWIWRSDKVLCSLVTSNGNLLISRVFNGLIIRSKISFILSLVIYEPILGEGIRL